jgi:8-oxo-dGTP pyrophosphatase MutT (NUDIX family)
VKWHVHSERQLYRDRWVDLWCADVELDDGRRLEHRFINVQAGAGAVVLNEALLLWRHRFITNAWNYEIPMGAVEPGEDPMAAAARETEEETGWRPGPLRFLLYDEPMNGLLNSCNHIFLAETATHIGSPSESFESDHVEWVPLGKLPDLIRNRQVIGGTTIAALLMAARERGV